MLDEEQLRAVASQLRQPQGENGIQMGEKMNQSNAHINQYTIEQLQVSPNDRILEIGMGNGYFVPQLLSKNASVHYVGCDFSDVMVAQAEQYNKAFVQNGQAQFILTSADRLPFAMNSFDKIFTVNTLYFWEEPAKILAELWRVLKPGGLLVVAIRPKGTMEIYPFVKYGFTMYTKEEVTELLSKNGFTVNHVFEGEEPPQNIAGESFTIESLIVSAAKPSIGYQKGD